MSLHWLRNRLAGDARRKILFWATVVSLICGLIEFGAPLENRLRSLRNDMHQHSASGEVVIVGIDNKSMQALGDWPWRRTTLAALIDRVREAGAKNIAVNLDLSAPTNPTDDAALAAAIGRAKSKIAIGMVVNAGGDPDNANTILPLSAFRSHAQPVSSNVWREPFGEVWRLFYGLTADGIKYPSLAAYLSGISGPAGRPFLIDHSTNWKTIPTLSAIDLLRNFDPKLLKNKRVIVGVVSTRKADILIMPDSTIVSSAYFHALGAETLLRGQPMMLGWLPPLLLLIALSIGQRRVMEGTNPLWIAIPGSAVLIVAPVIWEQHLVFVDVVPALLFLAIVTISNIWIAFRERSSKINALSGLPNLNALRFHDGVRQEALVVARIANFAEILSALPQESEKILVEQIVGRLQLGINGATVYQGDEGIFAWFALPDPSIAMGDQLEGLHAVFARPASVGSTFVDLSVVFGLDYSHDRSPANRIGSALVAAGEASEAGLKWKAYDPSKLEDAAWKMSLLSRLDQAIDTGEIWVAYQPKLDLLTGRIVGAEALARWSHPEKGDIPPQEFILAAEQHNRIEKLSSYILTEAVRVGARINRHGIPFSVAVNLSTRLLEDPGVVKLVARALASETLPPSQLTLEVTESAALAKGSRSLKTLTELRALGVKISIDDYGTGFSTLEYLRDIPANEIKIDRSFVSRLDLSQSDKLMVHSTIQLAHSLGRIAVAEGVERSETLEALRAMRCDQVQGYLIGRPMKFVRLSRVLLDQKHRIAA